MKTRARILFICSAFIALFILGASPALAATRDVNRNKIPDSWEVKYKLSLKVNQAGLDFDKDGLKNIDEYRSGNNPRRKDTNKNGVADGKEDPDKDGLVNFGEVAAKTLPRVWDTNKNGVPDGREDPDKDHLVNAQEFITKTSPLVADTNKNGVTDNNEDLDKDGLDNQSEFAQGCNPRDADSDDDGTIDGQEVAGFITGFDPDTGMLSLVALNDSERTLEVKLTDTTKIEWADDVDNEVAPALDDLKVGAVVNEVDGAVQADGSVIATEIKLIPAPPIGTAIAKVQWFDSNSGALGLQAASDEETEYQVLTDENTEFAWADGVYRDHDPSTDDLVEGMGVSAMDVTYTSDGELLARKIVLVPDFAGGGF